MGAVEIGSERFTRTTEEGCLGGLPLRASHTGLKARPTVPMTCPLSEAIPMSVKLERLLQFTQHPARNGDMFPILQNDNVLALEHRLKFLYPVKIDNGTAAHAEEFFRIELFLQRIQRLAQDVSFFAGINRDIIAGRFNGINLSGFNYDHFVFGPG